MTRGRWVVVALVALWAVLYLPNLRTNPNWYSDEGEWLEKCWTFIHGTPRVGPVINDFVFPYPYPPLYLLVNGTLLRVFGNDIVVGRALGAVTALAATGILGWIGCRLRDWRFGLLCALAFLVYDEAVMNFRWVRSHPLAGTLALACVGFLIRYVQEKRVRDLALAGAMCALATATNYFTYPLIGAVIVTVAAVNPVAPIPSSGLPQQVSGRVGRAALAGAVACSYAALLVLWYVATQPGGWEQLMAQVGRLTAVASNEVRPTFLGEWARFAANVWKLGFQTPTHGPVPTVPEWTGHDKWLMIATVGFVFLPARDWRARLWLPFWLLTLMFGVFSKLNNVPYFFYPATIFLPALAVGFGGVLTWAGELSVKWLKSERARWLPAVLVLGAFGSQSVSGVWGHFDSKVDWWTQHSVAEGEAVMAFVNDHTTSADFVLVPKQLYGLVKHARKSLLLHCLNVEGKTNSVWPVASPRERFWFDCRWQNARFLVLASGYDNQARLPRGFDFANTRLVEGVPEIMAGIVAEKWPVVCAGGEGATLKNFTPGGRWPVAINGEYLVLANPRFVK